MWARRSLIFSRHSAAFRGFATERAGKGVRTSAVILLEDVPHKVSKIVHGKRGKGGGFVRATLKNLMTSQVNFICHFSYVSIV